MAYDDGLAQRVREEMSELPGYEEEKKKMLSGIGFMARGNMACGFIGENLIVRIGRERYEDALAEPHTGPFDMTGRPMGGMDRRHGRRIRGRRGLEGLGERRGGAGPIAAGEVEKP
jgi:hypothetical protein